MTPDHYFSFQNCNFGAFLPPKLLVTTADMNKRIAFWAVEYTSCSLMNTVKKQYLKSELHNLSLCLKRECVFNMVIWPEFRTWHYRVENHSKHMPHFRRKWKVVESVCTKQSWNLFLIIRQLFQAEVSMYNSWQQFSSSTRCRPTTWTMTTRDVQITCWTIFTNIW